MPSSRKSFAIKCIIAIAVMYLCIHVLSNTGASQAIRQLQQSGRNLAALDPQQNVEPLVVEPVKEVYNVEATKAVVETTQKPQVSVLDKVKEITKCLDRPMVARVQQRGDYWVLYNYVMPEKTFKCHESITYTTHADYSFMDNLLPLLDKWRGPISLALHAPGTDFKNTLDSIAYLRDCTDSLVKEYVTFHIYFSTKHVPKEVSSEWMLLRFFASDSGGGNRRKIRVDRSMRFSHTFSFYFDLKTHFLIPSISIKCPFNYLTIKSHWFETSIQYICHGTHSMYLHNFLSKFVFFLIYPLSNFSLHFLCCFSIHHTVSIFSIFSASSFPP
jgi:hypothetical protein